MKVGLHCRACDKGSEVPNPRDYVAWRCPFCGSRDMDMVTREPPPG